jgi:hypothetical protein
VEVIVGAQHSSPVNPNPGDLVAFQNIKLLKIHLKKRRKTIVPPEASCV